MLFFSSKLIRNIAGRNSNRYIDGGLSCAPQGFEQCLNLIVFDHHHEDFFPVGYILLNKKFEDAYDKALTQFENFVQFEADQTGNETAEVKEIHCDFEPGLIKGVMRCYQRFLYEPQELQIVGCYFHLVQALWRRAGKIGIKQKKFKK